MRQLGRPSFLDDVNECYSIGRNVVLLTGDIEGPFWDPHNETFVSLELMLHSHLTHLTERDKDSSFAVARFDGGSGVGFLDKESKVFADRIYGFDSGSHRDDDLTKAEKLTANHPLAGLHLLSQLCEQQVKHHEAVRKGQTQGESKPLCHILQFAGALFPTGDLGHMSDHQWQRIVEFLNWISSPGVEGSRNLIFLIAETKSEINEKFFQRLNTAHVEIQGPDEDMRGLVTERFCEMHKGVRFRGSTKGREKFVENSAGLTTAQIFDILRVSSRLKRLITSESVSSKVNEVMTAKLGDLVTTKRPSHTPDNIACYPRHGEIFAEIFENCEDPATAPSAIVVSGPNGVGKTFQLEAHAGVSGRVVIELSKIRGSYFGETDRFFDTLKWYIATFGKVLILVDEAHTAIGSVHDSGTHDTERRLGGNIIKMMSDNDFRSKVVWGLMTSRPDELDPDVISRSPEQVPIFDPHGPGERKEFIEVMFGLEKVKFEATNLDEIEERTRTFSARDYADLIRKIISKRRKHRGMNVLEVLDIWSASSAIADQRRFQTLTAAKFCAYPQLLPEDVSKLIQSNNFDAEIMKLRTKLRY